MWKGWSWRPIDYTAAAPGSGFDLESFALSVPELERMRPSRRGGGMELASCYFLCSLPENHNEHDLLQVYIYFIFVVNAFIYLFSRQRRSSP